MTVPCPTCGQPLGKPCDRAVHAARRRAGHLGGLTQDRLRQLLEAEGEATVGLIAEVARAPYSTAHLVVQRAVRAGWVQRSKVADPAGSGRASIFYSLTPGK